MEQGDVCCMILEVETHQCISYEPRTYIPPRDQQAPSLGTHILWPIWRIIWGELALLDPYRNRIDIRGLADPEEILKKNGVDAYVYVRFLIMMARAMVPIWFVSWIILLPVDAARTGKTGKVGLDRYTLGNVPLNMQDRLWTHLILDVVFIGGLSDPISPFLSLTWHFHRLDPLPCRTRNEALVGRTTEAPH